jgi:DNA-binding FadR family transcriptional regulator
LADRANMGLLMPDRNAEFAALVKTPADGKQRVRKLSHLIARDLRNMILRGDVAYGQALPAEKDLIRTFDVSRETIREALRILESEGLIHVRLGRGGGVVVQRPEPRALMRHVALLLHVRGATFGDIHEVRRIIEPATARTSTLSAAELEGLAVLHDLELAQLDEPIACASTIVSFDQALMRTSGNQAISIISGVFRELIAGRRSLENLVEQGSTLATLVSCHGAILEALRSGDTSRVERSWSAYLEASAELLGSSSLDTPFDMVPLWRLPHPGSRDGFRSEKTAALIAKDIRLQIADGRLSKGDPLPPMPALASEYNVSRPIIRECLRMLEIEDLVSMRTGSRGGARVLEPSTNAAGHLTAGLLASAGASMIEVFDARHVIEPPAMELMALRADSDVVRDLSALVRDLQRLADDTLGFADCMTEFHRRAFVASRNIALSVALEILHWVLARCRQEILIRSLSSPQVVEGNRQGSLALATFVQAVADGDGPTAKKLWTEQLVALAPHFRNAYGDRLIVELFD